MVQVFAQNGLNHELILRNVIMYNSFHFLAAESDRGIHIDIEVIF